MNLLHILPLLVCTAAYTIEQVKKKDVKDEPMVEKQETVFERILSSNKAGSTNGKTLFEGDIDLITEPEISGKTNKRSVVRNMGLLWTSRIIPYDIQIEYGREMIMKAMEIIERESCVSFVKRTDQKSWIRFVDNGACYSTVGRIPTNSQVVSLTKNCLASIGTVLHELLHALGFWHEQARPDRDQYIEIMWENIQRAEQNNFKKQTYSTSDDMGTSYDFDSIMHYSSKAFSKNGKPTIVAIGDKEKELGQRAHLSIKDVIRLNALYKCEDVGKVYTSWSGWSFCDDNCQKNRQRFCPKYDSTRCPEANHLGVHTQYEKCTYKECSKPIDGHWGRWSRWSDCSAECGNGNETRTRTCDKPAPKHGGSSCEGEKLQSKECFIKSCELNPDDCQFDGQEMCFWTEISTSDYHWYRITGRTTSGNTGPESDHSTKDTTKDGHYMYTESSTPAKEGDKVSLLSKVFPPVHNRCMTFSYSMHGPDMGALRVYLKEEQTNKEYKIWEKIGQQGKEWLEDSIDITSNLAYKIRIESERGGSFWSDIGLDDIYFQNKRCSDPNEPTKSTITPQSDFISAVCQTPLKALGCFADQSPHPAMEKMLDSHRGQSSLNHGVEIDWQNYGNTLKKLLCDCVDRAKAQGMKYIGLQYYGECWGSKLQRYNKYGTSEKCIDSNYKQIFKENRDMICIGTAETNYVYEIV